MLLADLSMTGDIVVACGSDSDSSDSECASEYESNMHDNYTIEDEIEPNCCRAIWLIWYTIVTMCNGSSSKPE